MHRRLASPWSAGLLVTLAVAAAIVALQPVNGPWWTHGDADSTYTASSLNILRGSHSRYIEHPGLPLQELLAVTFGVRYAIGRAIGHETSVDAYVDRSLLDLQTTRPYFRGWAIFLYLLGAALSYILVGRLFGHWGWGLAGGLLWVGATGLAPLSIQFRPDVALAILTLVIGYLTIRAFERRDAVLYGLAALLLGFALTVKITAVGLALPLLLAAVLHRPEGDWWGDVRRRAVAFARRRRIAIAVVLAVWVLIAAVLNYRGWPFGPSPTARVLVAEVIVVLGAYLGAGLLAQKRSRRAGRIADPFLAFVLAAICIGIAIPATLTLGEGVQTFVKIKVGLTGGGAVESYPYFAVPLRMILSGLPGIGAAVMYALAAAAATVALRRRAACPLIWATAAAVLLFLALARYSGNIYYFSPGYVASVPAVIWLLRTRRPAVAQALVVALIGFIVATTFVQAVNHRSTVSRCSNETTKLLGPRLTGKDAVATDYLIEGVAYEEFVTPYVNYVPPGYVYHATGPGDIRDFAATHAVTIRYYAGANAVGLKAPGPVDVGDLGPRLVRPLPGGSACGIVELVKPFRA